MQFFDLMPMWPMGGAMMLLSLRPSEPLSIMIATPILQFFMTWFGISLIGFFVAVLRTGGPVPAVAPVALIGLIDCACALLRSGDGNRQKVISESLWFGHRRSA